MTTDEVLEGLVDECREDHVGLWEIVHAVQFDLGCQNPRQVQSLTLQLVRGLLSHRGMQVGHPAPDGRQFVSWGLSSDETIRRIEQELTALGREPNIGEVAWFTMA